MTSVQAELSSARLSTELNTVLSYALDARSSPCVVARIRHLVNALESLGRRIRHRMLLHSKFMDGLIKGLLPMVLSVVRYHG